MVNRKTVDLMSLRRPPSLCSRIYEKVPHPLRLTLTGAGFMLHIILYHLTPPLRGRYYYHYPHFRDKRTEAQRDLVTHPWLHGWQTAVLGNGLRLQEKVSHLYNMLFHLHATCFLTQDLG